MRTRSAALAVVTAAVTVVPALTALAAPATAANTGQVCVGLDSGKIDTKGDPKSVTVTAPVGKVITGYCVKAGSVQQGNGPVNVTLATPVATLVITHPSGKAVSHYSVAYGAGPTAPTTPTEPETPAEPEVPETPAEPETPTEPETEIPNDPAPAIEPWDWNWQYAAPTCDALTVRYPANLPEGQANDVNIRVRTDRGEVTLNYHLDQGTWSGTTGFTYAQHRDWPAGVTSYTVTWVQVAGTNHHWQGALACGPDAAGGTADQPVAQPTPQPVATTPAPIARTTIAGFAAGTVRVAQGRAVGADAVTLTGLESVVLQRRAQGTWRALKTVASSAGTVRVTFPKERRTGTYAYRLVVPSTDTVTGATSPTLKVKVVAKKSKR